MMKGRVTLRQNFGNRRWSSAVLQVSKLAKTLCNALKRMQNLDNVYEGTDYDVKTLRAAPWDNVEGGHNHDFA